MDVTNGDIPRDLHEDAGDVARALAATPEYEAAWRLRKRLRCCSLISNEFSASLACA